MNTSTTGALAIELQPHSSTQWIATYYPLVETPAGRWAEITWALHQCLIPLAPDSPEPARWLDARSPNPNHSSYANHQEWSKPLAAGYAAALAAYDAEVAEGPSTLPDPQQLREATIVVPAGQLSEWVLDDLEDENAVDVVEELIDQWPASSDVRYVREGPDGQLLPVI